MAQFQFPEWSDLGSDSVSPRVRNSWDYMLTKLDEYRQYFDGDVFKQIVPEAGNDENAPLLYPVGLNLVKMLCLAQADSEFGEWDEQPIVWGVRGDQQMTPADEEAIEILNNILEKSDAGSLFWEHSLERNLYGGGALKVSARIDKNDPVRWSRIPRENFFPIWDPDDPNSLLEVYTVTYLSPEQAEIKYGYKDARNDLVHRVEHWTARTYESFLNKQKIETYSGYNPFYIAPFAYTPRIRTTSWWGDSLTADLISPQDDLNMRVADIGDAINYNAHPVRWGVNMPRDFNAKNFPLGPNAFWNLGRVIGQSPRPEVGIMEASAAVAPGVFEYVKFIYDWTRTAASAPPVAFGEDNGGGQRSGATLEIRMWPLIKAIRRSRAYMTASLRRCVYITGKILEQKEYPGIGRRAIQSMLEGRIVPRYAEILPRDQQAAVDEVVKLTSMTPPVLSHLTAQAILGRGAGEIQRIKDQLKDKELYAREEAKAQQEKEMAEKNLELKAKQSEASGKKEVSGAGKAEE